MNLTLRKLPALNMGYAIVNTTMQIVRVDGKIADDGKTTWDVVDTQFPEYSKSYMLFQEQPSLAVAKDVAARHIQHSLHAAAKEDEDVA